MVEHWCIMLVILAQIQAWTLFLILWFYASKTSWIKIQLIRLKRKYRDILDEFFWSYNFQCVDHEDLILKVIRGPTTNWGKKWIKKYIWSSCKIKCSKWCVANHIWPIWFNATWFNYLFIFICMRIAHILMEIKKF